MATRRKKKSLMKTKALGCASIDVGGLYTHALCVLSVPVHSLLLSLKKLPSYVK